MSQTSRKKNIILSTPYLFQRDLFDWFCLDTRINLRKCSKRCQKLVDSMPLTFETFDITVGSVISFEYPEAALKTKDDVAYSKLANGASNRRHESGNDIDHKEKSGSFEKNAAEELGTIFSLPSLKIDKMQILVRRECQMYPKAPKTGNAQELFFHELRCILSALPHHLQVQEVEFVHDVQYEDHLSVVPYLKPGLLKSIRMENIGRSGELSKILNMEQVQQARSVQLNSYMDSFPFHSSLKNQEISVRLMSFSLGDLNRLIHEYLNYDTIEKAVILKSGIQNEVWMKYYVSKNKKPDDGVTMIALVKGPRFEYEVMVERDMVTIKRKFD